MIIFCTQFRYYQPRTQFRPCRPPAREQCMYLVASYRLIHSDSPGASKANVQGLHFLPASVPISVRPPTNGWISFEGGRVEESDLGEGKALLFVLCRPNLVLGGEAQCREVIVGALLQVGQESLKPLLCEENPWVALHTSRLDGKLDPSLDNIDLALLQLLSSAFTSRLRENCQPHLSEDIEKKSQKKEADEASDGD